MGTLIEDNYIPLTMDDINDIDYETMMRYDNEWSGLIFVSDISWANTIVFRALTKAIKGDL